MRVRKVTERRAAAERNALHLKSETNKNIINISYERTAVNLSISISSVTQIRSHHRSRNGARLCTTNSSVSHEVLFIHLAPPPLSSSRFEYHREARDLQEKRITEDRVEPRGTFSIGTVSRRGKLCEFISNRNRTAMSYRPCERQVVRRNNIYVSGSGPSRYKFEELFDE